MRRGVTLLGIALLVAAPAATTARAADGAGATTTTTTTSSTTTTTTGTTTTTPTPAYAPLASSSLPKTCVGAGVAAIREPKHGTLALGTPASPLGPSAYPDGSPILAFDSSSTTGSACKSDTVTLTNVSLFGGAVTAASVAAKDGGGTVDGLEIDGAAVTLTRGESAAVGSWGLVTRGSTAGRLSAPLALELVRAHGSLPKGTTIFLAFAAARQLAAKAKPVPQPQTATTRTTPKAASHSRKRHRKKTRVAQPLKWTPRLGQSARHYVFPVADGASYIDTYGANRNDIYDGWHHGDDLFAPLGTPVVAVATGKLSLVGWNQLGGWRLWLTDAKGNSFYYAHLSGYSRWILHHPNVKAGQVVGFLGRTGDAFTTTPHLHFEVHPHQLLNLGYDGAVDPTSYLKAWSVEKVPAADIPRPARLRAPRGTPTQEAEVVWKELLAARHLLPSGEPVVAFASGLHRPFPASQEIAAHSTSGSRRIAAVRTAAHLTSRGTPGDGPWPLVVLMLTLVASSGLAVRAATGKRRRSRTPLH